jgi:hypothetical protein
VEVETLVKALGVPLTDVIALLVNDHKGYMPLLALELVTQRARAPATLVKGALFIKGTVNAYIVVVLEL